jgi:hypothetical protein
MSWFSVILFEIERICYRSPNRNDVARVDQSLGKLHGLGDGTTGDGLETKEDLSYHFAGKTVVIKQLTFSIKYDELGKSFNSLSSRSRGALTPPR